MKTSSIVVGFVVVTTLGAVNGCSSSIDALSRDGAIGGNAPIGTGGIASGVGGGLAGATGTGGALGIDGGIADARVDAPFGTGGNVHATGGKGTGGVTVTGGGGSGPLARGGAGGASAGGGNTGRGGSFSPGGTGGGVATGGLAATGGHTGTGGAIGTGGSNNTPGCPYACRTEGSVTGWYLNNELVCEADCLGCSLSCNAVGTRSEGCYSMCGGIEANGCAAAGRDGLIKYMFCSDEYAAAYLAWQSPDAVELTGPAVVVSATGGWVRVWDKAPPFSPASPPANPSATYEVNRTQLNELFSRLAAVDVASLPHEPVAGLERCRPSLYFQLCAGCPPTTLTYPAPESVSPEMESVWAWFDQIVTMATGNPRSYCAAAS